MTNREPWRVSTKNGLDSFASPSWTLRSFQCLLETRRPLLIEILREIQYERNISRRFKHTETENDLLL